MKKIIQITSFFVCLTNLTFGQSNCDCEKFKIGKFEVLNSQGGHTVFTRTRKKQTEKSGEIEVKDKVVWLDECTYKLYPLKIKDGTNTVKSAPVIFKIIQTFEHAYIVKATIEGDKKFSIEIKVYEYGYLDYDK